MATYAVGDIQGCFEPLQRLLDAVNFSDSDRLWCAGDLVNRGPSSLETLRFIRNLGERAQIVLGNHDLHLIACCLGSRPISKKDTFTNILTVHDKDELLQWLLQQPLLHYDPALNYALVHAGIPPIWDLQTALTRAAEVEQVLQSQQWASFVRDMYGNVPDMWSDALVGNARLRVITNYFTRMRFCTEDGRLEFATKEGPGKPPPGFGPWFEFSSHPCRDERIVFGHWAALMGETHRENAIALDTGCVWGGALSAVRLEDGRRYSVPANEGDTVKP